MACTLPDAKPPFSVSALADRAWNAVAEAAFRTGWTPLARAAEYAVVSLMQNIAVGELRVRTTREHTYTFPTASSSSQNVKENSVNLRAELRVRNDAFWVRLCAMGDLGFAEAYMYGEVECDDLVSLFQIFLENKERLANLDSKLSYLFTLPQKITSYRFLNTISNSRSNISAHYDISNDMFAGFLSEDMTYSCAIFPELDGDLTGNPSDGANKHARRRHARWSSSPRIPSRGTRIARADITLPPSPPSSEPDTAPKNALEDAVADILLDDTTVPLSQNTKTEPDVEDPLQAAQIRKLQHIIDKLHIPSPESTSHNVPDNEGVRPYYRVLEIGSGWGSLAILLAQQHPHVSIDSLTLSSQQKVLADARIRAAGLQDRVTVHLMDYRRMPGEWQGRFKRFVSVEMIEAVGREFMEEYWRWVNWALDCRDGVGVVQVITIPEARFERYTQEIDFIQKWVLFPGGFLPSLSYLLTTLTTASAGTLLVESTSNIGPHYARTLREWRRRFEDAFEGVVVPALEREFGERNRGEGGGVGGGGGSTSGSTSERGGMWSFLRGGEEEKGKEKEKELTREEIEVFRRKWIYYYVYCEVGFTTRTLGDHIVTFTREANRAYECDVFE